MRKLTILFFLLTLSAGLAQAQSVFTYTATEKLESQFNMLGTVTSHEFSNGAGTVTYSRDVFEIVMNAFEDCTALQTITLPTGVQTIGTSAFEKCSALVSVTLPASIRLLGAKAFLSCTSLTEITVAWTEASEIPNTAAAIFGGIAGGTGLRGATLCVPDGTKALYQAAEVWKEFGTIFDLTEVKDAAIAEINEAATAAKAEIDAASTYPEANETQDYNKALIDATVMAATNAINNATNAADVERERDEYISTINEKRDEALAEIATINAKVEAIAEITAARHGIQNTNINNWIDGAITDIQESTTIEEVDRIKNEILEVINIIQDVKAEAFGEMGEEKTGCPAVKVTKGDKTIILYAPEKVEMIKIPATTNN